MTRRALIKLGIGAIVAIFFVHICVFDRATWYGESWRGKKMANRKPYDPDSMTCASWDYPLGSSLRVTAGKKSVIVEVTDRGGRNRWYQFGKTVDLTPAAFIQLASLKTGTIQVRIEKVPRLRS
jgi:rare lipoprotein A